MVRFDIPCANHNGALAYFSQHMGKGDYLTEGGAAKMLWVGKGSELLGLRGQAQHDHFSKLCQGNDPFTGEKLGVRDKGSARRVCYFGQISAPKDVSIACLVGGDDRIQIWWKEAVEETLQEIELATQTRIRKNGASSDRETGNMVAAVVTHDASRSLDPQLHTHVCIMNLTYDVVEKRWKGVQPSGYFRHQGFFREVCYNKLAQRMQEGGYQLEKSKSLGFSIRGMPEELRQRLSKRRAQILAEAERLGAKSQDALQAVTSTTRAPKQVLGSELLKIRWVEESADWMHHLQDLIQKTAHHPPRLQIQATTGSLEYAEDHLFERSSVSEDRTLLREALIHGRGHVEVKALRQDLNRKIKEGTWIQEGTQITSKEMLGMEREYSRWTKAGQGKQKPFGDPSGIGTHLSTEQQTAVRTILKNWDRVVLLEGDAGTGKTTALQEILSGIHREQGQTFCCAPTSGATEVLRKELDPEASTLQDLLVNPARQQQLRNKTLVVDEAGLISTRQMRDLCRLAKNLHFRVILVGDIKQHSSVEAGDALRALKIFGGITTARLKNIRRQQDPAYRKAVGFLAAQKPHQAFRQFERIGAVREIPDSETLFQKAAEDYVQTLRSGKTCLAICPVWSEIRQFTVKTRQILQKEGVLSKEETVRSVFSSYQWTKAERKNIQNYKAGDVLCFHQSCAVFQKGETLHCLGIEEKKLLVERSNGDRYLFNPKQITSYSVGQVEEIRIAAGERLLIRGNLKAQNLHNGDLVEVAHWDSRGSITLKDGRVLPENFHEFIYGYATTSHAAQGKTVDRGIVIMSGEGIRAGNMKQAYVSHSRFRETMALYVANRQEAREVFAKNSDRQLAMELKRKDFSHLRECEILFENNHRWKQQRERSRISIPPKQRSSLHAH